MSESDMHPGARERMAEAVRLVIGRRERAPRSPRMERALKRIIWRYNSALRDEREQWSDDDGSWRGLDSRKTGGNDE